MNYMTTKEAAEKWKIIPRRVRFLAQHSRIPGAIKRGHDWLIPITAIKPDSTSGNISLIEQNVKLDESDYEQGRFGQFGGSCVPETYKHYIDEILLQYKMSFTDFDFLEQVDRARRNMIIRPTPLYSARNFSRSVGNLQVYIKREDLTSCGSIYINQVLPMLILAKKMKKKKVLCELGDENYGTAVAYAANYVGLHAKIFIAKDAYENNVDIGKKLKFLGAEIIVITEGNGTLYDATNACFREFIMDPEETFYMFHDAFGPHPLPLMASEMQKIVGTEAKSQLKNLIRRDPDFIVSNIHIASNALGIFSEFCDTNCKLFLAESEFINEKGDKKLLTIDGKINDFQGCRTKSLAEWANGKCEYKAATPGNSHAALNPQLLDMIEQKRATTVTVTEEEAVKALIEFSKCESIIPSIEDGYSLAVIKKLAQNGTTGTVLIAFTGKGDKDINFISKNYHDYI